jgi:hypothetical protein
MRFAEVDLFGVYVAPISLMMVATWLFTIALRRVASRFGLLRYVWHPPGSGASIRLVGRFCRDQSSGARNTALRT